MISDYYHAEQLRGYLLQICGVFAGLQVETGQGKSGQTEKMSVPVVIGSRDRVVAAVQSGNTQNRPFALPVMAVNMSGLALNPNRKGIGVVDNRVYLSQGGVFPEDLRTLTRVMPIPYLMSIDLSICTSNTQQTHQILEQLLMLFDPKLTIQTSDAAFDWTKITDIELVGISNEENYPAGTDRRIINWTLQFELPIYISPPADVRDDLVRKVIIRLGDMSGFGVNEIDENGEMTPFTKEVWSEIEITERGSISKRKVLATGNAGGTSTTGI